MCRIVIKNEGWANAGVNPHKASRTPEEPLVNQTLNTPNQPAIEAGQMGLFVRALAFASEKHRNQRRKDSDASPYINHPIALANVLANEGGVFNPVVLAAAVLHDTVEDTETTAEELAAIFGDKIAATVLEVTDDKTLDKNQRKQLQVEHAPHISDEAKLVKLADKICNLRDILASPPANWSAERKQDYFNWAAKVIDGLRGIHPGLENTFDAVLARSHELL